MTILTVLSRYPDMSPAEADSHIARIQQAEVIPLCHAILGRINSDTLNAEALDVFNQFSDWSQDRTNRVRAEQISARQQQRQTRLATKLTDLFQRGQISEHTLLLYGISGNLPPVPLYARLTEEQKEAMWADRMEDRFGPLWRDMFTETPFFVRKRRATVTSSWQTDGF